jgi:hypothetical protein
MGAAVADGDQSNEEGAGAVDLSSLPTATDERSDHADPLVTGPVPQPGESGGSNGAQARSNGADGHPTLAGTPRATPVPVPDAVTSQPEPQARPLSLEPQPFSLEGLLLLDSIGKDPIDIDVVTFDDQGIGVIRSRGDPARVLPWSSVVAHVVEAWSGGVIPEWWVDPELDRGDATDKASGSVTDPGATSRPLPHAESGALIAIRTRSGTYRFLLPHGDARTLSRTITAFAVEHQGPNAASSVTRVVAWGQDIERRQVEREPNRDITWSKVRPFMVVVLVVLIGTAVTLILLQSAGAIHLPYLGGAGSGTMGALRSR